MMYLHTIATNTSTERVKNEPGYKKNPFEVFALAASEN